MRTILGCVLGLLVCSGLSAVDDKIDATKLIGKWQMKPEKDDKKDDALYLEFGKDGKVTETFTIKGKEEKDVLSYKVDGNTLSMTQKVRGKEETTKSTITKLTDTELVLKSKSGDEDKFVRVKDKK